MLLNCRLSKNSTWSLMSIQSGWGGPRVGLRTWVSSNDVKGSLF